MSTRPSPYAYIHDMVVALEKGEGKAEVYGTLSAEERALIEAGEQEK